MSASCITSPVGTPGGTRTRSTEILRFRCLPFASRERLVEPAGFEPALPCTSSKCLLPVGLRFHEISKSENTRRPVSHSGGAGLVELQLWTEVYISNPEHTPLSSCSFSCNWAFNNSRFVCIRFRDPFFSLLGQTGAKYITTLPSPSMVCFRSCAIGCGNRIRTDVPQVMSLLLEPLQSIPRSVVQPTKRSATENVTLFLFPTDSSVFKDFRIRQVASPTGVEPVL